MAQYYIMSPDGKKVLSRSNSAWSFKGAISSFMFSATVYCISQHNDVVTEFYPPELIVGKKSTFRNKISGVRFCLFKAIGDTRGKDALRYIDMGPVCDEETLFNLNLTLSTGELKKVEYIKPSELIQKRS